ncbi:hypothetical protein [Streptantibioticus ferralitis]|uniref:Uncharacterized protein n=1 Tax=Streptantibioticus ferralitis TaxID=236510 RepID=A0ABT5Z9S5_9ACTN|nr:hypothetical protein [Streptantibioticus ferralitis]MDF2260588.1 hypothetical protein [Streptantibioticus ferralitis]
MPTPVRALSLAVGARAGQARAGAVLGAQALLQAPISDVAADAQGHPCQVDAGQLTAHACAQVV